MKKMIRKNVLELRAALTMEERACASLQMEKYVLSHKWFADAQIILLYASYGSEIGTMGLIQKSLELGKRVFLPKVEAMEMEFYEITSLQELTQGYKGIPEPNGNAAAFTMKDGESAGETLMIMPGVAFDQERNRIGYGKGYYDKYLDKYPLLKNRTIAVGFLCQMVEQIPAEEKDIKPAVVMVF